jgi:pantoate--beta-alanine ligase
MKVIRSVASMQRLARRWQRAGIRVGFVPTMGCLHDGHMSLVRNTRKIVGSSGCVVVSIYVNPTQFGPAEDFAKYPRELKADLKLCRASGVDVVFAPADDEIYFRKDPSPFSTYVAEESLARRMEGASRPTHFRGVTTIVAKLFNIVLPEVSVFGAKDFQQATIIRRMVRDLNFPVRIVVAPTRREADGLAMSSRNRYLTGNLRQQAVVLWLAIQTAQAAVRNAGSVSVARLGRQLRSLIEKAPDARVDYIELFNPDTLEPVKKAQSGTHMALAVFVGTTRLIDNATL